MKSFRRELVMHIPRRRGFVNITGEVEKALAESAACDEYKDRAFVHHRKQDNLK